MLVLSRYVGESIIIDTPRGKVVVTVKSIRGKQVSIGIEAPRDLRISRPKKGE